MNLPPFVKARKFWEGLAYIGSGVLALLVYFDVIPAQYALAPGAILMGVLALLRFFGVETELKARNVR